MKQLESTDQYKRENNLVIECPICGQIFGVRPGGKQVYCSYCGEKISLRRNEYVIIDHARIIEAETDRIIKNRKMSLEERQYEDSLIDTPLNRFKLLSNHRLKSKQIALEKQRAKAEAAKYEAELLRMREKKEAEDDRFSWLGGFGLFAFFVFLIIALIHFNYLDDVLKGMVDIFKEFVETFKE
ncbi:MAG: hypothetical protein IJM56_01345 [Clostridia bacterium]|nr:hypothetical protein [Clostridia bacterium]MBQ9409803.1 hypothetical protein [Clostridia bacterium]